MNNKHFDSLMKANALDDSLARRIEVCFATDPFNHTRTYALTRACYFRATGVPCCVGDGGSVSDQPGVVLLCACMRVRHSSEHHQACEWDSVAG